MSELRRDLKPRGQREERPGGVTTALFEREQDARAAIIELSRAGLDPRRLSLLSRDYPSGGLAAGLLVAGGDPKLWGRRGAFWSELAGVLTGAAFLALPRIGNVIVLGALTAALSGVEAGSRAGVLGAALAEAGLPQDSAARCEMELKTGRLLLLIHGAPEELAKAQRLLGRLSRGLPVGG
jgi:hypothetical protein